MEEEKRSGWRNEKTHAPANVPTGGTTIPQMLRAVFPCAALFVASAAAPWGAIYLAFKVNIFFPWRSEVVMIVAALFLASLFGWLAGAFLPLPGKARARLWMLQLPLILGITAFSLYLAFSIGMYVEPPFTLLFFLFGLAVQAGGLFLFGAGFFLGARKRPPSIKAGKKDVGAPLLAIAASLAALGLIFFFSYKDHFSEQSLEIIGHGIDISDYSPLRENNKLVTPDASPSLCIAKNHPRLDGAIAILPVYASAAFAVYRDEKGQAKMRMEGDDPQDFSDSPEEIMDGDYAESAWNVACTNTREAFMRLVMGEVDIFFGVQPSQELLEMARAAGVNLSFTPLGREAFVFFVNKDNAVENLTVQQIRDIYTKRVTNWRQVGGPNRLILAFQRPEASGSQSVMRSLVMRGQPMARPPMWEYTEGMGDIIKETAAYRNRGNAIGFSFRWYATVQYDGSGIRLLRINGVEPTAEAVQAGLYPFTTEFYAITARPLSEESRALLDWMTGPEGQALVAKVGYVPLAEKGGQ